jgi:hypothetical protein
LTVVSRATVLAIIVSAVMAAHAASAAVPSENAATTSMVDRRAWVVRAAGRNIWVGGTSTRYLNPNRGPGPAARGLAAFDPVTGAPATVSLPNLGTNPTVYDLFPGPNGTLYVAGRFSYSFGGKARQNLVGINPATGAIVAGFSTPKLRTVLVTADRIYAGGVRLEAYRLDGRRDNGFQAVVPVIDDSLRSHDTQRQFRDLVVHDGAVIAIGQFDFINGDPQKVAVKLDPVTGKPRSWKLANIAPTSAAFGLSGVISGDRLYVAVGGSDFAGAYRAQDGSQIWKSDTSGSAQVVSVYDPTTVIVGGHFEWVARSPGQQCGSNQHPNTSCFQQPRLAAFGANDGRVNTSYTPRICCNYAGVWGLAVRKGDLHVSGAFTQAGGRRQYHYARFG